MSILLSLTSCQSPNKLKVFLGHDIKWRQFRVALQTPDTLVKQIPFLADSTGYVPEFKGEQEWQLYYRDSAVARFKHYKQRAGDRHDYHFLVYKKDSVMVAEITIRGASQLDTMVYFVPIQ